MRQAALWLAVGLLVGYLVGVRSGEPERAPLRSRFVELPRLPAAEIRMAPNSDSKSAADEPAPVKVALRATGEIVTPTARRGDLDPEDLENADEGIIEVDFRNTDGEARVWLEWVGMSGNVSHTEDAVPDDGSRIVRRDDTVGRCSVWWHDRSGRRHGTLVEAQAGWVTRIDAADPRYLDDVPIPHGLGLVEGRVRSASGGGLAHYHMFITVEDDELPLPTSSTGAFSATLRPGEYTLEVGDLRRVVTVNAGHRVYVEISHENEGDLLLNRRANIFLRSIRGDRKHSPRRRWDTPGGAGGAPYVKAGEYDVFEQRAYRVPWLLGRVTIRSGHVTRLDAPRFKGAMFVQLDFDAPITHPFASLFVKRIEPASPPFSENRQLNMFNKGEAVHCDKLPPGRYEVIVNVPGFARVREEITIADKPVKVEIAPVVR